MKNPRPVKIERVGDSWLVLYLDRKKGQRYTAGQFYAKTHTIHEVANWIFYRSNGTANDPQCNKEPSLCRMGNPHAEQIQKRARLHQKQRLGGILHFAPNRKRVNP